MNDYLIRAIAKSMGLRVFIATTAQMVAEARANHQATPVATTAIGRALTSAALIGALLKVKQRVAMKFEGNGPMRKIIVESNSYGRVRGYVGAPQLQLPAEDIVAAIGPAGLLTVVKDVNLPELVESVVPLQTSTIDDDIQAYLEYSEQIPSHLAVDLDLDPAGRVLSSGGILVQAIPPDGDADGVAMLVDRLQEFPPMTAMLGDDKTPEQILTQLLEGIDYQILEKRELEYKCNCSRERSMKALLTLGKKELQHLLDTEQQAVVDCHFCHTQYIFDDLDLEILIEDIELDGSDV